MKRYLFLLFLAISIAATPAVFTDPCLQQVRDVFDKMNESTLTGKTCYLNYSIKAVLNEKTAEGKNIISSSSVELMTTDKNSWFLSEQMEIYKDNKAIVTVMPGKKSIYLADAVNGKKEEKLYDKLRQLQDTLFKYTKKTECVEVKDQKYNKMITLYMDEKMSKYMEMKKVVYCINTTNNTLQKVFIEYLPEKQYKTLEYVFTETSYDYKKKDITQPVLPIFLSRNKLKPAYSGYKLIDNRKETYNK